MQEDSTCTFRDAALALQPMVEESELLMPFAKNLVKRVKTLNAVLRRALKRADKVRLPTAQCFAGCQSTSTPSCAYP
jgi:hypothetical protein